MTVLVTGGAGYIGSQMVLELLDAGEEVIVLDDLSTGFRRLFPEPRDWLSAMSATKARSPTSLRQHDRHHHSFCWFHYRAGNGVRSARLLSQQHLQVPNPNRAPSMPGSSISYFPPARPSMACPSAVPLARTSSSRTHSPYGSSKLMTEIMLRDTANAHDIRYMALRYFNVAGADPQGRSGQSTRAATHLIKVAAQTALGERPPRGFWQRLSDPGWDVHTRLHPRQGLGECASCGACLSSRRRQERRPELRLWPRILGSGSDCLGQTVRPE